MEHAKAFRVATLAFVTALATWPICQAGQVTLDHSLGQTGQALAGPNFSITADKGRTRGNNLFFSFAQFDLSSDQTATFSGPNNIQNILSRVTGGQPSSIDGLIKSEIPGANFFLINPKGIVFGPNAQIDVSGAFAVSTADYLKLADGARFVAALNADDSTLSSAPVSAFGFLGASPGSITVQQSSLNAAAGTTISMVGGDISLDGSVLQAPGGRINVISVKSTGEVAADVTTLTASEFKNAFPQQGQVNLRNGAQLDVSGEGGGRIVLRGGTLTVDNSRIQANTTGATDGQEIDIAVVNDLNVVNGGQINTASTLGVGAGGNIHITASSVRLDGQGLVDDQFNPTTQISATTGDLFSGGGIGKGGDIVIKANSVELMNSAQISSSTFGLGPAGQIDISATSVRLDGLLTTPTQITASTWDQEENGGKAGDIVIQTGALDMVNGATILAATFGSGNAGLIDIESRSVNLLNAAIITAGTFGVGNGGNVQIKADSMRIDGRDTLTGGPDFLTGIQAVTTTDQVPAPGGGIHINAGSLEMVNGASIFTDSFGLGPGGGIDVQAVRVTLGHNATIRAAGEASGPAGSVSLQVEDSLVMTGGSALQVSAAQSDGGDITVTAGGDILMKRSEMTAQAAQNGGNISLVSPSLIYLFHSPLTANAGQGNGGRITFDPSFVVLNESPITARVDVAGNGGEVMIHSDFFFAFESPFDVTTPSGIPGTVTVTAPDIDLSGSLVALPASLMDASAQLQESCALRFAGGISSLIVVGKGGMLVEQGGLLPSFELKGANAK